MNQDINKYITIPMGIAVLKQDREKFNEFKMGYLYQDLIDTAIKRMEQDFYRIKGELFNKVKLIEGTKYNVNNKVVEFSSQDLKEMTTETVKYYFSGSIEWREHVWDE